MAEVDRWVLLSLEETTQLEFDPERGPREVVIPAGSVLNIMLWDGETEWNPGEGMQAVLESEYLAANTAKKLN